MQYEQQTKRQKVSDTTTSAVDREQQQVVSDIVSTALADIATSTAPTAPTAPTALADIATPTVPTTLARPVRNKKHVQLIDTFHMNDSHLQPFVKSAKCNLVPLVYAFDKKSPVLIQMNGGGVIPKAFGVDDKETEGRRKVTVAFQIDSMSDHNHLERLRVELGEMVAASWSSWYPDVASPSKEVLMNFCNAFVSPRKKKKNSEERWSGLSKAVVEPDECENGKCKIMDRETGEAVPLAELAGRPWHKVILELRWVYIQATKSYGITKKLRYLLTSAVDEDGEIEPL
jgi:hypothetical protein